MASGEQVNFNAPHEPTPIAKEAFSILLRQIKSEIIQSRRDWDKHEPKMWSRAAKLSDSELEAFTVNDLDEVRGGPTSYGTIILGKFKIPAIDDAEGAGYVHVRIHDPPNRGNQDVVFHSIWTDEGNRNVDGQPTTWRAIQTKDTPLEFFNE